MADDSWMAAWESAELGNLGWTPRAMVIDDSVTRRTFLVDWLVQHGLQVEEFENGQAALATLYRRAEPELPHLLLTDVQMPHMGGPELALGLARDPRFDRIAVILYSGASGEELARTVAALDAETQGAASRFGGVIGVDGLARAAAERLRALPVPSRD